MTTIDIYNHLKMLKDANLSQRVEDIARSVFDCIDDDRYGQKFVKKDDFIKDFNKWLSTEFMGCLHDNWLTPIIPNGKLVCVKLLEIPWVDIVTKTLKTYYLWIVQVHNGLPILTTNDKSKRVVALCSGCHAVRVNDIQPDEFSTIGAVVYVDALKYNTRFRHILMHEITHFASFCILNQCKGSRYKYPDSKDDEFTFYQIDEFISDIVPYYITRQDDRPEYRDIFTLRDFKQDLYIKFNPSYSELYTRILRKLV